LYFALNASITSSRIKLFIYLNLDFEAGADKFAHFRNRVKLFTNVYSVGCLQSFSFSFLKDFSTSNYGYHEIFKTFCRVQLSLTPKMVNENLAIIIGKENKKDP
jgi:hypothetical protein